MSTETLPFKTELKQLLDIIVHSLYSHKDIFLRELISNASDAIDTLRFQALTQPDLRAEGEAWKIKIIPDEQHGTLTISDNGIGMTKDAIVENLGTIAKSGTRALLESLKSADVQARPELIGQFGVGFYSAFMVAAKVTVRSRAAGAPKTAGVQWESAGQGEFTVEEAEKESRGTGITSSFIFARAPRVPQGLEDSPARQETLRFCRASHSHGRRKGRREQEQDPLRGDAQFAKRPCGCRPRSEISDDAYKDFYKHLSHDFEEPAKTIHYSAEGQVEFKALLFIPKHKPFDLHFGDSKKGLHLYIRRIFIMDDCEALLPHYLRFVRGVVDSPDLPLNVSREMLQQSAPLDKIKTNLVNKILRTLEEMKNKEYDSYLNFFQELGVFLKEGLMHDVANRDALAELMLFESTKTEAGKVTSLADYVQRMPGDQQAIYFLSGENRAVTEHSPLLESFKAKGQEVLFFLDPLDEFLTQSWTEFKGKKLQAVDKGELDSSAIETGTKEKFQPLLNYFKEKLPDIKEARLSNRLKERVRSASSRTRWGMGANMGGTGHGPHGSRRRASRCQGALWEINPDHPLIATMQKRLAHNPSDEKLERYSRLLYDQAVVAEGSRVKDPVTFARLINELLVKDALV